VAQLRVTADRGLHAAATVGEKRVFDTRAPDPLGRARKPAAGDGVGGSPAPLALYWPG